jgi:hypothetical protein
MQPGDLKTSGILIQFWENNPNNGTNQQLTNDEKFFISEIIRR